MMLHKCANPNCAHPFRKLSEGKLFLAEVGSWRSPESTTAKWDDRTPPRVEYFWLCDQCACVLTLSFEKGKGMVTVPLPEAVRKRPVAVREAAGVRHLLPGMEHPFLKRA
jgi:hypothetical protein